MSEEVKVRRGSLDDLTPDDRNMNKHTSYGMSLIEKSIRKHKFGRSILVDKNDRIVEGISLQCIRIDISVHKRADDLLHNCPTRREYTASDAGFGG